MATAARPTAARALRVASLFLIVTTTTAHDTPVELPAAQSVPEAWNVVEQSKSNIDQLLAANLMRDVAAQIANIAGALKVLDAKAGDDDGGRAIHGIVAKLATGDVELLRDSRAAEDPRGKTQPAWDDWCKTLKDLESHYPTETVKAEVYICPMHPSDRHLKADDKCTVCGMSLVRRHLPASGVWQKPGEPTMKLTAVCPPLRVGQLASVTIKLAKADGSPVKLDDLIEMHTKKIHLLINDTSLSDYHHEHPTATNVPGEFTFSFTPTQPGPYRVWADVVPAATGIQEYEVCDLPAESAGKPVADKQTRLVNTVDGRKYQLVFDTKGKPIKAGETIVGAVSVTGSDGKGFVGLEPVMGAFAHIVGFSEDRGTVLHIHPYSKTPAGPDDRAGPAFAFKFYAPTPGFWRLYCQVQIGGAQVFVPFNVNVDPADAPVK
jgi:hypothetical protein